MAEDDKNKKPSIAENASKIKTVDVPTESPRYPRHQFMGDLDRNQVDIDLDKFVRLLDENAELKDKVRSYELGKDYNPYMKAVWFAKMLDAWRIFPRVFIVTYLYILYQAFTWFIGLPDPTMAQAGLISTVVGAGAAWFGLYVNSKGDGKSDKDL